MEHDNRYIRIAATAMRHHLGLSVAQLSSKLGVSGRLISYLESGERVWSDELLIKLEMLKS